jgi:hypothetical protein
VLVGCVLRREGFDQVDMPRSRKAQIMAASSIYKLKNPSRRVPTLWHYLEAIVIDQDPDAIAAMEKAIELDKTSLGDMKKHFRRRL